MAKAAVSPNRMELMRLKKELNTARRGHKMLKDKRDELMRQFMDIIRDNQRLRKEVDVRLNKASEGMALAAAIMSPETLQEALLLSQEKRTVDVGEKAIMGVHVPQFELSDQQITNTGLAYGLAQTTEDLDQTVDELVAAVPDLLELAQVEKTVQMLASEIEKTRRRVNSLEYVMIPALERQIHSIIMKMEENERGNLTRLMKVKDMIIQREILARREADAQVASECSGGSASTN